MCLYFTSKPDMCITIWFRKLLVLTLWAIAVIVGRIFGCEKVLKKQLYAVGSRFGFSSWTNDNAKPVTTTERILEWIDNVVPGPPENPPKRPKRKSASKKNKAKKSRRA
ncbi:hypothetical protein FLAG1_05449 [Fusarium langsethiae]|uniref:Uncharacterized protein n=1 Tax=Fusarium langsethiae TaxID=179993 RepID=A0A0M9EXC6_FUSLA|nr:hypothetical protein FLAG1_05449 [Fusarium langsethiae]GKU09612.1 unnamed protein product [Fusarium langsethiae]GKU21444.1 unnamed protein product [Fusarium langsethiae]